MPQKILSFLINIYKKIRYYIERFYKHSLRNRRVNIEKKALLNVAGKRHIPRLAQFRYITHFLSKRERNILIIFASLTLISFLGLFTLLYLDKTTSIAARGGEYIEGVVGYSRFINPLYSQGNDVDKDMVALIYSGLTKRNDHGAVAMDLAEKYDLSSDEKTYTFSLKDNVLWHDGKKFSADDVVFTIEAIQDKKYASPLSTSWADIKVSKIDDKTVQFELKKPFSSFLSLLTVGILPKHIWEKVPAQSINLAEANNKPIGTGPYRFKSFVKDKVGAIKSYQLEINDNYYDKKPNIEKISLKFFPDYPSAVSALDNRQIDGLAFVPSDARNLLKLKGRLALIDINLPQYTALFVNSKQNSLLKSTDLVKALAQAIDRKKIIKDALDGDGELIDGPILPGYLSVEDTSKRIYYDKTSAENELVSLGWTLKNGAKIRTDKNGNSLKISITTIEKNQNTKAAGIIKENWEAIGVEVELKIVSAANITKDVIEKRNYETLLFGEMYGPDLDPYQYWHSSAISSSGLNLAGYSNRKADALLEQARKTTDRVVKQDKYKQFQELVIDDVGAIFLWQPKYVYLIDKKVKGVNMLNLLTPSDRFTHLMSGYIKTKRTLK